MTPLVHARVETAPNFLNNLEFARLFFIEQDADSATERFLKLKVELREYIVNRHVVLYAHSEVEVVLLALKQQRQLTYLAEG
jgi:hypothetical protein